MFHELEYMQASLLIDICAHTHICVYMSPRAHAQYNAQQVVSSAGLLRILRNEEIEELTMFYVPRLLTRESPLQGFCNLSQMCCVLSKCCY